MGLLSDPSFFVDPAVVATRTGEVPNADWAGGVNAVGSCAEGISIGEGIPDLVGEPQQFTLLDQDEVARTPQISQYIGGTGLSGTYPSSGGSEGKGTIPLQFGTSDALGVVTPTGDATLTTLAAGWVATP